MAYYDQQIMPSSSSDFYVAARRICSRVLELDNSIRVAALANNMGSLVANELRKGLVPLLNEEELQDYMMKAVLRMKTREDYSSKLGDIVYTFTLYKKIKRATIPLGHKFAVLTVSFDMAADHESIIMDKILPVIAQEKPAVAEA
jgi:hypothetical protein